MGWGVRMSARLRCTVRPVRALLIANANDADAGFVGERFRSHGYAFDECHREHPGDWPSLDGHELKVEDYAIPNLIADVKGMLETVSEAS